MELIFKKEPLKLGMKSKVNQNADPFLFENEDVLYCFYEEYIRGANGRLKVCIFLDFENWYIEDIDIGEDIHLSYPFISRDLINGIYMVPETSKNQEVAIYQPLNFPFKWQKSKVILKGNYVDSHIFFKGNKYYLFTTKKLEKLNSYQLELFVSDSLFGEYKNHPMSPISEGRKYGRSAGSIFEENGKILRPVQDCSERYGNDVNIFEIIKLDEAVYEEHVYCENYFRNELGESLGGHHISFCNFQNEKISAYDFNIRESYFQRFINKILI